GHSVDQRDLGQGPTTKRAKAREQRPDAQELDAGKQQVADALHDERRPVRELRAHRDAQIPGVHAEEVAHVIRPARPGAGGRATGSIGPEPKVQSSRRAGGRVPTPPVGRTDFPYTRAPAGPEDLQRAARTRSAAPSLETA